LILTFAAGVDPNTSDSRYGELRMRRTSAPPR
jgi:hypothetical protein